MISTCFAERFFKKELILYTLYKYIVFDLHFTVSHIFLHFISHTFVHVPDSQHFIKKYHHIILNRIRLIYALFGTSCKKVTTFLLHTYYKFKQETEKCQKVVSKVAEISILKKDLNLIQILNRVLEKNYMIVSTKSLWLF